MGPREIKHNIYSVGAIDYDRRLFDSLIPLPDGTSYNSYVIKGSEKTVLIDTVDPAMTDILIRHLEELGITRIDYIVAHHGEQDHSGSLGAVLKKFPDAIVLATPKCKTILMDLLLIPDGKFKTVGDKETISLGDKTLEFIHTPWVHWPETMVTYLKEDQVLFSCDFFGSHLAATDLFVTDEGRVYEAAKRYFAEIMMPFRNVIQGNMDKIKNYDIKVIAASHGPVYDKPQFIIEAYRHWAFDNPKNIVVLPYVSMHGTTRVMVDYLVEALMDRGVAVERFELSGSDVGKLAMSLVDAATVVIGTPTVLAGPHPLAAYAAFLANALRPNIKFVSIIGSYSWGGKTVEILAGMIQNLKAEVIEPVLCKGVPREADFKALDRLADSIAEKHRQNNFS
ncbi:MAG: MBL fold hydrolase [Chloroflexi bacterium RBG_16_48_7]|nr:MAG: MBL fold hydrolase [Chloroflexi bacterium RBG_16_48_7]